MKYTAFENKDNHLLEVYTTWHGKLGICIKYNLYQESPELEDEFKTLYQEYNLSIEPEDIEPLIETLKEIKVVLDKKSKIEEK